MTPEGRTKIMVKRAFSGLDIYTFMPVQRGLGASALDFYCCCKGMFIAIETKVPGAKLTLRQVLTAKMIAASGGIVCVVRDDDDIKATLMMIQCRRYGHIYDALGSVQIYGDFWWRR